MFVAFFIFAFISPVIAFVYSCYQALETKKTYYFFCIAFLLAFFSAVMPPWADGYRYMLIYQHAEQVTLGDISILESARWDVLYTYLSVIFNYFNCDFWDFRFFLCCSALCCWAFVFKDVVEKNIDILENKKIFLIVFLLFICGVNYVHLSGGLRYAPAMFWMFAACYLLMKKQYFMGFVFATLSIFLHYSMVMVPVVMLVAFITRKERLSTVAILIIPILLSVVSVFAGDYIVFLDDTTDYNLGSEAYVNGYWAAPDDTTWRRDLRETFNFTMFAVFYYVFAIREEGHKSYWRKLAIFCSWMCFFTYNFSALRDRVMVFCYLLWITDICITCCATKEWKRKAYLLLLMLCLWQGLNCYAGRKSIFNPIALKSLLYPAWTVKYDFYDSHWMLKNLDDGGDFR